MLILAWLLLMLIAVLILFQFLLNLTEVALLEEGLKHLPLSFNFNFNVEVQKK